VAQCQGLKQRFPVYIISSVVRVWFAVGQTVISPCGAVFSLRGELETAAAAAAAAAAEAIAAVLTLLLRGPLPCRSVSCCAAVLLLTVEADLLCTST
jgi:hypothetical protein